MVYQATYVRPVYPGLPLRTFHSCKYCVLTKKVSYLLLCYVRFCCVVGLSAKVFNVVNGKIYESRFSKGDTLKKTFYIKGLRASRKQGVHFFSFLFFFFFVFFHFFPLLSSFLLSILFGGHNFPQLPARL